VIEYATDMPKGEVRFVNIVSSINKICLNCRLNDFNIAKGDVYRFNLSNLG
jgi:hypothetical protein